MTLRAVAGGGGGSSGLTVGTTAITGGAAYAVLREDASQNLAADTNLTFGGAAAGTGLKIVGGTATTDVPALSVTRTNNNASVVKGVEVVYTDTASAAGFLPLSILGGAAGSTSLLSLGKAGLLTVPLLSVSTAAKAITVPTGGTASNPQIVFGTASAGSIYSDSSNFGVAFTTQASGADMWMAGSGLRAKAAFIYGWTASMNEAIAGLDTGMSRVSAGVIGVGTGAAASVAGTISAAAYISGGSAGVDFGPGVVTSITVKKGIITAIS